MLLLRGSRELWKTKCIHVVIESRSMIVTNEGFIEILRRDESRQMSLNLSVWGRVADSLETEWLHYVWCRAINLFFTFRSSMQEIFLLLLRELKVSHCICITLFFFFLFISKWSVKDTDGQSGYRVRSNQFHTSCCRLTVHNNSAEPAPFDIVDVSCS